MTQMINIELFIILSVFVGVVVILVPIILVSVLRNKKEQMRKRRMSSVVFNLHQ